MNDHYSVLGVGRQATTAEIANAYHQLLIRERQDKGEQADFGVYSLAYRTLTNQGKRQEYDRFLDELSGKYLISDPESPSEAEKCYLAGLTCMEQKNFQDAVDYLYRSVQLEPETSHFCSQLGLALGMFKDRLAEAERYCKKAISLDPDNPDFRFNLGFLYQRHNLVDAAQTAFDLANEAIRSREARLLRENEPLITPWQQEGQDLLDELSRLESIMDAEDKKAAAGPSEGTEAPARYLGDEAGQPAGGPVAESRPLGQPDEPGSGAAEAELAGTPADADDKSEPLMEPFLDDDLLKELDLLEAQVRGVEELHNGEVERAAGLGFEGTASGLAEAAADKVARPYPPADLDREMEIKLPEALLQELSAQETTPAEADVAPGSLAAEALPQALAEEPSRHEESVPGPDVLESAAESPTPETISRALEAEKPSEPQQEFLGPEVSKPSAEHPAAGTSPHAVAEGLLAEPETAKTVTPTSEIRDAEQLPQVLREERPASHTGEEAASAEEQKQPKGAAAVKLRMLEDLEREMLGELEALRREKERLQAAG